jgi:hypothetical protein
VSQREPIDLMDTTATGIALGLICAAAYTLIRAVRQKSFEIGATILVFLAGFAIPGGVGTIERPAGFLAGVCGGGWNRGHRALSSLHRSIVPPCVGETRDSGGCDSGSRTAGGASCGGK